MLYRLSDLAFYQDILLYIDLNKVDLVNPKPQLLLYSDAITEVIMDKREKLIATVRHRKMVHRIDTSTYHETTRMGK